MPELCCIRTQLTWPEALKGADHLDFIVQHRLFRPRSTATIEEVYDEVAPDAPDFNFVTATQIEDNTAPKEKIILPSNSHTTIAKRLQVPELSGEIERAVWQVDQALRKDEEKSAPKEDEKRGQGRKRE